MEVQIVLCLCDLLHCQTLTSSLGEKVIFANNSKIMEFDVDTRKATVLVEHVTGEIDALDYDSRNKYIYFPSYPSKEIMRFKYPSESRTLERVIHTAGRPIGLALDYLNDYVYWIQYYDTQLFRCNLNGTNVIAIPIPLNLPFVLRLDVTSRWIYMVDRRSGISKSRYDLTEHQTIVNFAPQQVDCMALDSEEHRLYWINNAGEMKSSKDDGSDVSTILSTNFSSNYYAIGVFGSFVYYANYYNQLVMINKEPGSTPSVLFNHTNRIYSIFVLNSVGMFQTINEYV